MNLVKKTGVVLSLACMLSFGLLGNMAYTETSLADTADISTYTNRTINDAPGYPRLDEMFSTTIGIATERRPIEVTDGDLECMAKNIYFEAGTESWTGKLAVGRVVLNRVADARYPGNICDVIYDGYRPGYRNCQFSWYCDGKSDRITDRIRVSKNWQDSERAAVMILLGGYEGIVEGATHYHANYVRPAWRHELTFVTRIDTHIFYRWE